MLTKLLLSGTALVGGVMNTATADPPVPPRPARDVQPAEPSTKKPIAAAGASSEIATRAEEETPHIERKRSPDEEAIGLVDAAFIKAYESGDAKAVAALFTTDAEYVDEAGVVFEGRDAIEASLIDFFADNPACKLLINAHSVRTISPGVVMQDGSTVVTRSELPEGVESRHTSLYVEIDGKWLIASVRNSVPRDLQEHSAHLQQLSWLKGDWVDEGDDSIINFSCEAVDRGNFLLRKFTIIVGGEEAMSGTQRIGWDPLSGKLRAWIFDTEGAYAEGYWHRDEQNHRWVLKTTGVTPTGQTASSTSIYTFVNEHTMTWQSVDHEIAGVQQPDSEIVTIVRNSPGPTPVIAVDARE